MSYSLDLRKRLVEFVQAGGSKADSSRMFSVSLWCVNEWCKRDSLKPISPPGRPRNKLGVVHFTKFGLAYKSLPITL